MDAEIITLAERLGECLKRRGWVMAAAESCTGGGIAYAVTETPGSSAWFDRGFVTYSNEAKVEMLGVAADTLAQHGAVSAETATAMVEGALSRSLADCALAVTGIAGPTGGSAAKPVGTVFIAWLVKGEPVRVRRYAFTGGRRQVREATVKEAVLGMLLCLRDK
ncbi:MAG: CinA family protein [Gammaproteobacteria bacterium]